MNNITKVDGDTLLTIDGLMVSPKCPVCVNLFSAMTEMRLHLSIMPDLSGVEDQDRGTNGLSISVVGTVNELREAAGRYDLGLFWGTTKSMKLIAAVDEEINRINENIRAKMKRLADIAEQREKQRQQRLRKPPSSDYTVYGAA